MGTDLSLDCLRILTELLQPPRRIRSKIATCLFLPFYLCVLTCPARRIAVERGGRHEGAVIESGVSRYLLEFPTRAPVRRQALRFPAARLVDRLRVVAGIMGTPAG